MVLGGPEVGVAFSALPFDHLFVTGSTQVGRKVMAAAAQLVTLELGGKSPAIIAPGHVNDRSTGSETTTRIAPNCSAARRQETWA